MINKQSGIISFVIPAMNEEMTLEDLYLGIKREMNQLPWNFEVIFIDDGSTDGTWGVMERLAQQHGNVRSLQFRRNIGKARALAIGFECSQGDLVFTMDADLQDDPKEIPKFITKLAEGYDVLSGYKKKRHDPWHKVWPSRVFNRMLNLVAGTDLHDHNCGFKCYRREVIEQLNPYGEMHRMLASLSSFEGYHVGEVVVEHRAREFGYSKYGVKRFIRGFMDMLTVGFLGHYSERPMHLAGLLSIFIIAGSFLCVALSVVLFTWGLPMADVPLIVGLISPVITLPLMGVGLVAELIISGRLAYNRRPNIIRDTKAYFKRDLNEGIEPSSAQSLSVPKKELDWLELLVVDDSDFARDFAKEVLCESGCRLVEARDGIEGLERINEHTAVVISDLKMPRMNGEEFVTELREKYPKVAIIVVSSISEVPNVVSVLNKGAVDYLTKPIQPATLKNAVKKALEQYHKQA